MNNCTNQVSPPLRAVVVGARGYSGAEVVRLLSQHAGVNLVGVFGSAHASGDLADHVPSLRNVVDLELQPFSLDSIAALAPDAVFLATPHAFSHDVAAALLKLGTVVLDLSGAFRLNDPLAYSTTYGFEHVEHDLLHAAAYGMAEINAPAIAEANLVAVPGCYPTASVLGIRPALDAQCLDTTTPIIIDATSGVSGAGRTLSSRSHFCEVSHRPYGVLNHRHQPEIEQALDDTAVIFTPHLGPYDRGIVATIHARLQPGVDADALQQIYTDAYANAPLVRLRPTGDWPGVADVAHTPFCDIAFAVDTERAHLIVISAIDNLLKGAAAQAVQCMNIRFGLPETLGLVPTTGSAVLC